MINYFTNSRQSFKKFCKQGEIIFQNLYNPFTRIFANRKHFDENNENIIIIILILP